MAREMKDSGIEWIGEIPKEWHIMKMNMICSVVTDYVASGSFASLAENVQYLDEPNYAMLIRTADVSGKGHVSKPVYINKQAYEFLSNSNLFGGEIILPNIGGVGEAYIVPKLYEYMSLAPNSIMVKTNYCDKYYYYCFNCEAGSRAIINISQSTAQAKFNKTDFKQIKSIVPPLPEQEKIAEFLDSECAKIDEVISKTKSTIEEYKKLKQSVITEAVTKGIRPDREMKDSGIEWIGDIPKEWEVVKMKHLGKCRNGLTYSPENLVSEYDGTLVLRSSNIKDGRLVFVDNVYVNTEIREELMVKAGDILICSRNGSRALIGKNALIPNDLCASFGAFMMIFRCQSSKYVQMILNSAVFSYYLGTFLTSTINQLTADNFNNMQIVYCQDEKEKEEIVEYLEKKCTEIDTLIAKKEQIVSELESYKKSLIYEYVTGKKEVV